MKRLYYSLQKIEIQIGENILFLDARKLESSIEKIISLTLFLQSEYAHIILKLESCSLLKTSDNLKSPAFVQMVNNSGMNFLLDDFYKYIVICLELEDYKNKNMTVLCVKLIIYKILKRVYHPYIIYNIAYFLVVMI